MTEKKCIETLMKRIGYLSIKIEDNPNNSFDKSEREALMTLINAYQRIRDQNIEMMNELGREDNYGNK